MKAISPGLMAGLLASTLLVTSLAGCAPPAKDGGASGMGNDGGRKVVAVDQQPKSRGPFKTVTIQGVEYRQSRDPVGEFGGTLYSASIGQGPKTFNAWLSSDSASSEVAGMMVSGLVDSDPYTGEVVPALARSVEINPDKVTYTVTLRKGLTWSDGKPLTARDVVFTWNEIIRPGLGNPSARDNTLVDGQFPEVRQVDDLTVTFKTAKPFAPFLRRLGYAIAPAHVFQEAVRKGGDKAFSAMWGTSDAAKNPEKFVSSGMWVLDRYDMSEQRVIFKRNPRFFMVDADGRRLPYLDQYVISYAGDQNNLQLRFEQGKLDSYTVPGRFLSHVRRLAKPQFTIYNLGPSPTTTFIMFNLSTRKNPETGRPYVDPVKSRWFTNTRFRNAVDWAINRADIVKNICMNVAQPLHTAESPTSPFVNPDVAKGHPQDLDKARALLKEAGFRWDAKNRLLDDRGNPVAFNLYTNSGNDEREAIGVNLKQDLSKLGITVYFKPMDFNVLVGMMDKGEWEAMIMGLGGGSPLEPHDSANIWKSGSALHLFNQRDVKKTPVDLSDRFPWEAQIDALFEQGAQTFVLDERKAIYHRWQALVDAEDPLIYLYSPLSLIAVKSRLQNVDPTPLGGAFHNLESIWVKPEP